MLETANKTGALLLTADKDFGDLVFSPGQGSGWCGSCTVRRPA
ncbi:MAG: hypothetical protein AB1503_12220 [Bacillota bacterium]